MGPEEIFIKTDKGRDEIATRRRKLTHKQRALLILVDGRKAVAELVRLNPASMDVPLLLRQLRDRRYIRLAGEPEEHAEELPGEGDPPTAPISERPDLTPVPEDISAARTLAVRLLNEAMGRDAKNFVGRLEGCATGADLLAHAERYAIVIGTVRNKELGDTYLKQVRAALAM